jgi:hypothetical protein
MEGAMKLAKIERMELQRQVGVMNEYRRLNQMIYASTKPDSTQGDHGTLWNEIHTD